MSSSTAGDAGLARSSHSFSSVVSVFAAVFSLCVLRAKEVEVVTACYATWAAVCLARLVSFDTTAIFDGLVFAAVLLPSNFSLIRSLSDVISTYALSALPVISSASLLAALLISGLLSKSKDNKEDNCTEDRSATPHFKPLIFPCRTTHTRFFPKKHSFAYSYLLVGVPVWAKDHRRRYGSLLSVDTNLLPWTDRKKGWFHIQGSDYLERGGENLDLRAKLTQYLRSQGVSEEEWHHAYLVTAAKFLGYSFNPVSFWYIYSQAHQLVMMILEVNNTFDERRMYLLKASSNENNQEPHERDTTDDTNQSAKFTNAWAKDFHVSPFNSRKGSYSLSAIDPFNEDHRKYPQIDNNIVLRSSEKHPKLVARIFSEGKPKDPTGLSAFEVLSFISSWWWVGLVTFPRILKEAYKLYFQRSLQVFFRPEVVPTSIGRNPTVIERNLESFFRRYLCHVVSQTNGSVQVSYTPAPGIGKAQELLSAGAQQGEATHSLEIRVTSPAFYSRFMHYAHTSEALDREGLFTDEKNRTVWISNPKTLKLLPLRHSGEIKPASELNGLSDVIGWNLLRKLRRPAAAPSYVDTDEASNPAFSREDIRPKNFSACDEYVMQNCPDGWLYRRCLFKAFLATGFGLGFTEVIDLFDFALRISLVLGVLLVEPRDLLNLPPDSTKGAMAIGFAVLKALGFNAVHLWSLVKESL